MIPLNKALILKEKQKPGSKMMIKKPRLDSDVVNIDGKNVRWGHFKKKWLEEARSK